jgi:hypothetical protein
MSHSPGQVLDEAGAVIGHFEYNGTVDVARPQIFATAEARDATWREVQPEACACHGIDVTLATEGLTWHGRVCLKHGFIVDGRSPVYGRPS